VQELYNKAQLEVLYRAHLISINDTEALETFEAAIEAKSANSSDERTSS
jgi:hypothetical protein